MKYVLLSALLNSCGHWGTERLGSSLRVTEPVKWQNHPDVNHQGSCPLNSPKCFKAFLYVHICTHVQVCLSDNFLKIKFLSWRICIVLVFIDTVKSPSKEITTMWTPTASVWWCLFPPNPAKTVYYQTIANLEAKKCYLYFALICIYLRERLGNLPPAYKPSLMCFFFPSGKCSILF